MMPDAQQAANLDRTASGNPDDRMYVFIINPQAGHRTTRRLMEQIRKTFRDCGMERFCEIVLTERKEHATEVAKTYGMQMGARGIIFACGGDGTVNEVANGLYGTGAALGIIPTGTANDFARQVLSTTEIPELLTRLTSPVIRPLDLFTINDRLCINITSFGLDTKVQMLAESINRKFHFLGGLVYPISIVLALFGGREFGLSYELSLRTAEGTVKRESGSSRFVLSAICNGGYYGGGYHPAPDADPTDGLLDICIVDNVPLREILKLLPRYKAGTHRGHPAVHAFQAQEGIIRSTEGNLLGNYDGEIFQAQEVAFKVLPGALPFAYY